MAKLVIGTNKQVVTPAIVRDMSPAYYVEKKVDNSGRLTYKTDAPIMDFTNISTIDDFMLPFAFSCNDFQGALDMSNVRQIGKYGCYSMLGTAAIGRIGAKITSLDLSNLKTISDYGCYSMCANCKEITSCDMSKLEYMYGSACYNMFYRAGIKTLSLSNLMGFLYSSCAYSMFAYSDIETLDLPSLYDVYYSGSQCMMWCFCDCYKLKNVYFRSLVALRNQFIANGFYNCSILEDVYFYALRTTVSNACQAMLTNVSGCTLHFPKNLDPQSGSTVISSLNGYPNFGGTNTVISFDLPSSFVLTCADNKKYERHPKCDTDSVLAWRINGESTLTTTVYYTNGVSDPVVGDTVYSDIACTTAETTISSIA